MYSLLYSIESLDASSFSITLHGVIEMNQRISEVNSFNVLLIYNSTHTHTHPTLQFRALHNVRITYNLIHSFNWCKYRTLHLLCIIWTWKLFAFCFIFKIDCVVFVWIFFLSFSIYFCASVCDQVFRQLFVDLLIENFFKWKQIKYLFAFAFVFVQRSLCVSKLKLFFQFPINSYRFDNTRCRSVFGMPSHSICAYNNKM